jgi:hypothetical protein
MKLSVADVLEANESLSSKVVENWKWIIDRTPDGVDLSRLDHREFMHKWLNKLRCRIEYGTPQDESVLSLSLHTWWKEHRSVLVELQKTRLYDLTDPLLENAVNAAADLSSQPASHSRNRKVNWVATSKVLMAVSPRAMSAWDNRIAADLYGGLSVQGFRRHLDETRQAACELNKSPEIQKLAEGPEGMGFGKLIDQTLYYWCTVKKMSSKLISGSSYSGIEKCSDYAPGENT